MNQLASLDLRALSLAAWVDSAGGKTEAIKGKSRSAIVVGAQDHMERVYWLHAWAKFCTTDELIRTIFDINRVWRPGVFGADATGTQIMFINTVNREARDVGEDCALTPKSLGVEKQVRIETWLQPRQAKGQMFVTPEAARVIQPEYEGFPGPLMDVLDAMAGCCSLFPARRRPKENNVEDDSYREYLLRMGLRGSDVDRRVEQLRHARNQRGLGRVQ